MTRIDDLKSEIASYRELEREAHDKAAELSRELSKLNQAQHRKAVRRHKWAYYCDNNCYTRGAKQIPYGSRVRIVDAKRTKWVWVEYRGKGQWARFHSLDFTKPSDENIYINRKLAPIMSDILS